MKLKLAIGSLAVGMLLIAPTMAKPGGNGPCAQDMQRLCPNASNRSEMRQCMQQNKGKFSQACQAKMKDMRQKMNQMHQACAADRENFCKGVKPGQGRMRDCYIEHQNELSEQCKAALPPGFFSKNPPPEMEGSDPQ